jgi:hypothetical protein
MMDSSGICSRMALKTDIPPTPESNTPIGEACWVGFMQPLLQSGFPSEHVLKESRWLA